MPDYASMTAAPAAPSINDVNKRNLNSTAIVKLATAFEKAHYPPSALSTFHARDYREALTRMSRYKQLCPPENLRINSAGPVNR